MRTITSPGIYTDMAAADYFADPCPEPSLTQSIAKILLDRSPAHARLAHPRLMLPGGDADEEKYDKTKAIGNAAHLEMIGRGKEIAVADFDSWRTKEAKAFRAEVEAAGKTPILGAHHEIACAMVDSAREQLAGTEHEVAFDPVAGDGEVVLAWREEASWLRTMIDWRMRAAPRYYDYKTTALSCAPHVVEDRPGELGWDVQAAMHERGLDVLDPDNIGRRKFFFVNQENESPYALTVIRISEADLTLGRKKLAIALDIWRACMSSRKWPRYPAETIVSHPRGGTEAKWLDREIAIDRRRQIKSVAHEPMLTDLSGG